jgi:hypothetical protein
MRIITAPETLPFEKINKSSYLVFLAGGITNCPPWQPELIKKLDAYCLADLVLLNPRRDDFDITNPNMSEEQIDWEHFMLNQANLVSFWFSAGPSMQPITLYEYGKYSTKNKNNVVVGTDPNYLREFDVNYQSKKEGIYVVNSLDLLAASIVRKYKNK